MRDTVLVEVPAAVWTACRAHLDPDQRAGWVPAVESAVLLFLGLRVDADDAPSPKTLRAELAGLSVRVAELADALRGLSDAAVAALEPEARRMGLDPALVESGAEDAARALASIGQGIDRARNRLPAKGTKGRPPRNELHDLDRALVDAWQSWRKPGSRSALPLVNGVRKALGEATVKELG